MKERHGNGWAGLDLVTDAVRHYLEGELVPIGGVERIRHSVLAWSAYSFVFYVVCACAIEPEKGIVQDTVMLHDFSSPPCVLSFFFFLED